ncbi:Polyadenylate-binding protein-interacting protein 9, partial [Dichanthelium oligosanthes]
MAAALEGSASGAVAKEVEYQAGVQKLVDLLSKLNPAAKEFVPSSAAAASPPKKALSADAPMFDYHSIGAGNGGTKDSATDAAFYPQRKDLRDDHLYARANTGRDDPIEKYDVTEERLADIFATCGQVVDCRICGDPHSVLRFAFIEFSDEEGARTALNLGGTIFGFYPVRVLPSKTAILPVNPKFLPRTEDEKEMVMRTVYCTNIDKLVTQLDVKNFFEELCGEVSRLRLLGDNVHSTRIAFVEFVHAESAIMALNCSGMILGTLP